MYEKQFFKNQEDNVSSSKKMRALCVLLAVFMAAMPFSAAAESAVLKAEVPIIRMTGGQARLTDLETGEAYESAYDLTPELVSGVLSKMQDPLMDALKKLDWKTAARLLGDFILL
jgi:hypothetical protein